MTESDLAIQEMRSKVDEVRGILAMKDGRIAELSEKLESKTLTLRLKVVENNQLKGKLDMVYRLLCQCVNERCGFCDKKDSRECDGCKWEPFSELKVE